jgi:hypothetical protein
MPADGNSQFESLWDTCAATLINTWDIYGWVVPALLLTILFFAAIAQFCWALEDISSELPVCRGPKWIFHRMRLIWRARRITR